MTIEYTSMLLAKLFSTISEDEMTDLLNDIGELGDPIFLFPVYQAYKNNKTRFISHYFLSAISKLDSTDITKIGFEIGEDPSTSVTDLTYVLEIFDKAKIYNQRATNIALSALYKFMSIKSTNEYSLYSILSYLKNSNKLPDIENNLLTIFSNKEFNTKSREYAFGKWLEIDPKKNLQVVIDKFEEIKTDNEKERIIAKTISTWKGTKSEELKSLIEKEGNLEASNIIKRLREKDLERSQKENSKKDEIIKKTYSTVDLIENITTLREKINDAAKIHQRVGFTFFPPNESVFTQLKTADDDATLIKVCISLREIIQDLSPDLGDHGLEIFEIKKLLPDTSDEDINKSINKLFLFLSAKNFTVDNSVFGLKQLNQIVGLLGAHPRAEKDKLSKKLVEAGLDQNYREEEWGLLHRNLLKQYITFLEKLFKAIEEKK
jgi:hypothetical protein